MLGGGVGASGEKEAGSGAGGGPGGRVVEKGVVQEWGCAAGGGGTALGRVRRVGVGREVGELGCGLFGGGGHGEVRVLGGGAWG